MEDQQTSTLRPLQAVLIGLVAMAVAGGSWLLSAAESATLVDGAIEWQQESPLRAVVQLSCLNYQFPTIHAGTIKTYLLGVASGLAVLALGVGVLARRIVADPNGSTVDAVSADDVIRSSRRGHLEPLFAAQLLLGLFLLWSFASYRRSAAPDLALGGSILLTIYYLWAFALGHGLNRSSARVAVRVMVGVSAVTAMLALWYYYGRNPTLRAKFPYGNPNFLSACLIPGILLATAFVGNFLSRAIRHRNARALIGAVPALAVIIVALWAFHMAGSRGPMLGLAAGFAALAFFMLRGRAKVVPVSLVVVMLFAAWMHYSEIGHQASPTGRSATIRFRSYSWRYAFQMFAAEPFAGHGQGGFVLAGDSQAVHDVLDDPLALNTRIAHAHNEWLEVMADLGSVGIALLVAALGLTMWAGIVALRPLPLNETRWSLAGLLAVIVGLIVEESFGVGLRVSGVPTFFYTALGLIWAMSRKHTVQPARRVLATPQRRCVVGTFGVLVGLACLVTTQQDFQAARAAFRLQESVRAGDYDTAIEWASVARSRLNPQRALTNLYRLAETHMLAARWSRDRAADRERRAALPDVPDRRLLGLAAGDRIQSDHHCNEGSTVLKELVAKAPGWMNHGLVLYGLNVVQADNAAVRGEPDKQAQYLRDAATALERELPRQPFNPSLAVEYVHAARGTIDAARVITLLARPLRHNRITIDQVDLLADLTDDPVFAEQFDATVRASKRALEHPEGSDKIDESLHAWMPEVLRLAAAIRFRRGDYDAAAQDLERATEFYEKLAGAAPIGAAACYAALADCQFLGRPDQPEHSLASIARAVELAPESLVGRRLKFAAKQRMVDYFLAGDHEDDAKELLRETLPSGAAEETVLNELGIRYRKMCETMLQRRLAFNLRQSPNDLLEKLEHWVGRAIELSPSDSAAHYVAADLTFHQGSCEVAVGHLRAGLATGLPAAAATSFLIMARSKDPNCDALRRLEEELKRQSADNRGRKLSEPGFEKP